MLRLQRRVFLKKSAMIASAGMASLLGFEQTRAAQNSAGDRFETIMAQLFGQQDLIDSDRIFLTLPDVAENGAIVPLTVSSELEAIDRIYLLVEKNPTPLAATFELSSTAMVYLSARIKMAESSHVVVIARRGEQLLSTRRWVEIGQGGCGTG